MKLRLDENLSRRIVPFLQADFPGTSQVALEGPQQADDAAIWHYAQINGFVIVSKDSDFQDRCWRSADIEGSALGRISDKAPGSTSVLLLL